LEEQNRRVASRAEGHRAEWAAWDATMAEARASDAGLKAPAVLLTATKAEDELQPIWIDAHRQWARRCRMFATFWWKVRVMPSTATSLRPYSWPCRHCSVRSVVSLPGAWPRARVYRSATVPV